MYNQMYRYIYLLQCYIFCHILCILHVLLKNKYPHGIFVTLASLVACNAFLSRLSDYLVHKICL
jgi:hypothetical protein